MMSSSSIQNFNIQSKNSGWISGGNLSSKNKYTFSDFKQRQGIKMFTGNHQSAGRFWHGPGIDILK